jgi:hypothetical protein
LRGFGAPAVPRVVSRGSVGRPVTESRENAVATARPPESASIAAPSVLGGVAGPRTLISPPSMPRPAGLIDFTAERQRPHRLAQCKVNTLVSASSSRLLEVARRAIAQNARRVNSLAVVPALRNCVPTQSSFGKHDPARSVACGRITVLKIILKCHHGLFQGLCGLQAIKTIIRKVREFIPDKAKLRVQFQWIKIVFVCEPNKVVLVIRVPTSTLTPLCDATPKAIWLIRIGIEIGFLLQVAHDASSLADCEALFLK